MLENKIQQCPIGETFGVRSNAAPDSEALQNGYENGLPSDRSAQLYRMASERSACIAQQINSRPENEHKFFTVVETRARAEGNRIHILTVLRRTK